MTENEEKFFSTATSKFSPVAFCHL